MCVFSVEQLITFLISVSRPLRKWLLRQRENISQYFCLLVSLCLPIKWWVCEMSSDKMRLLDSTSLRRSLLPRCYSWLCDLYIMCNYPHMDRYEKMKQTCARKMHSWKVYFLRSRRITAFYVHWGNKMREMIPRNCIQPNPKKLWLSLWHYRAN